MGKRNDMKIGALCLVATFALNAMVACDSPDDGSTEHDASSDREGSGGTAGSSDGQGGASGNGGAAGTKSDASDGGGAGGSAGRADATADPLVDASRDPADHTGLDANDGSATSDSADDRNDADAIDGSTDDRTLTDGTVSDDASDGPTSSDTNHSDTGIASDADPFAPRGAVSGHLTQPSSGMDNCSPGVYWVNAPYPPRNTQTEQVTESSFGDIAVDGSGGQSVSCTVKPNGAKFAVTIDVQVPAIDGDGNQLTPAAFHAQIPSIGTGELAAAGAVQLGDNRTWSGGLTLYAGSCTFSVYPMDVASQLSVATGRIWAQFRCDNVKPPAMPGTSCGIDVGYLVFENCKTQ